MNNNGHGLQNGNNGHKSQDWLSSVDVKESPFISPRIDESQNGSADAPAEKTVSFDSAPALSNDADLPPVDPQLPNTGRRKALFLSVVVLGLICAGLGAYALNGGRKIEYRVAERKTQKPGQQMQAATGIEQPATDQVTANAINEAKEELRKAGLPPAASASPEIAGVTTPATPDATQRTAAPIFAPYTVPDLPATMPRKGNEVGSVLDPSGNEPANRFAGGNSRPSYSGSSQPAAHSIYVEPVERQGDRETRRQGQEAKLRNDSGLRTPNAGLAVPSFGSMLPVRTLGAVFTLRSSLVRLETTRDVEGDGWKIKRGTVLVAQQQGSDYDRAFLTLMGFIDPATNRFVKLSGDLIGADGAPGLKGKRRQINSRWTRVFSRLGSSAVQLGQAALSRGNTTIVVPGGLGGTGTDFGFNPGTIARREFVEIPASTPAYVMITDLPKEVRGVDAEPAKTGDDFLADEELAELLSTGNTEQIRAALPRMQPEMRKIALLALGERQD